MSKPSHASSFNQAYVGPRPDILALMPPNPQRVLDVGCSDGTLGESIKQHWPKCQVVGMELTQDMGTAAKQKLDQVLIGDIEASAALEPIALERFDTIIFADVLEHLRDPWLMLRKTRPLLSTGGVVITSIPNVRHIDTIYNLVFRGEWPYRDRGIHDRTHLRFFTRKNIQAMFESEGFKIQEWRVNYRLIERPHPLNRYARFFAWSGLANFLAFQYLVVAAPIENPILR